ncbi:histone lysine demethylase PHF8-like isoform X1 [Danaus plexippus]|uniref:histone lysine demethylase PHF8-like isoform X1 n=1 Tax=Danaus plexippus TaxID=13037 RepID=UPI002AB19F49|nr:histone lysine demethylase PHF8-like isoform X1 [Danaus plexippus]
MASSKETYCLCGQPYNIGQFMIECDCCREWFHGSCVDVKIYHSDDIDKYHCPKCAQTYGPSVLKIPTNNHRADRYELGAETRPSQAGSPAWVRALSARPMRPTAAALTTMRPEQFTEEFVRDNLFTRPVIFNTSEGLDMKVPNANTFNVRSVLRYCGAQLEVEVIDVRKQSTLRMPLGDFVDYFETPQEHRDEKVLNVLSLEFTDTNMCSLVEPPLIARSLDWARTVWSSEEPARPHVQRYCLMSASGSYTDFHIDFGGTTVWYHVLHGRKVFYLIPPTATNLALYQQWSAANNQTEKFFGDMVEWYGTAELSPGETLFIPTGWIHAVYTPTDSLVFGGNLLHSYAIEMQLQIYEIESRVETPVLLRYPLFEALHWLAAAQLLAVLRRINEETQDEDFTLHEGSSSHPVELPPLLLRGIKILANALKEWHTLKATDASKRDNVPKCINSGQLVRELCKELRTLEKRNTTTKDKDVKQKNQSPTKSQNKKQAATPKKPIKLTLPKPIMHMNQNTEFVEEKPYADKYYVDNKEVVYADRYIQDVKYIAADVKYVAGDKFVNSDVKFVNSDIKFVNSDGKFVNSDVKYVLDGKEAILPEKYSYQNFEEVNYQDNGYGDRQDKKAALKVKLSNSPSSSREEPPPYSLPEHSILKSHLIRTDRSLKPVHQWTISKKDIGDYHEEEILFTNENLQTNVRVEGQEMNYGAGMYSAEDMQQEYQYGDTAKGYHQLYHPDTYHYTRYEQTVTTQPQTYNGTTYTETQLPSYDAAIAHQYQNNYVIEEKPPPKPEVSVRRSERPVRRRVSSSYSYDDDLYIDDTPPPRRKPPRQKHNKNNATNGSYRAPSRPAPTNGIESLIQASVLAEEEAPVNETEDAAVAGMLSISERYEPPATFGIAVDTSEQRNSSVTTSTGRARVRKSITAVETMDEFDEEDVIKEVHRDEEYVYPSLEMSSDDEEDWSARRKKAARVRQDSRGRSDKDDSWCPRGRLPRTPVRPRPTRTAVKRECVRAALHAASVRTTDRRPESAKRAVLATKSRRPPAPVATPNKNSRLKKGMKTAKQRLGKILKIHKMIY